MKMPNGMYARCCKRCDEVYESKFRMGRYCDKCSKKEKRRRTKIIDKRINKEINQQRKDKKEKRKETKIISEKIRQEMNQQREEIREIIRGVMKNEQI